MTWERPPPAGFRRTAAQALPRTVCQGVGGSNMVRWTLVLIVLAGLLSCEGIFTTSLASPFAGDPSPEEALASGDRSAMEDAYKELKDDAASSSDGDEQLLAGQLAMELSGLSDLLYDVLADDIDFSQDEAYNQAAIDAAVADLDSTYLSEAASFYALADTNEADMDATDYLIGGVLLLAAEVESTGTLTAASGDPAFNFLDAYLATADPADSSYDIVAELRDFCDALS